MKFGLEKQVEKISQGLLQSHYQESEMDLCFSGLLETGRHKRESGTAISLTKLPLDGISLTRFNPIQEAFVQRRGSAYRTSRLPVSFCRPYLSLQARPLKSSEDGAMNNYITKYPGNFTLSLEQQVLRLVLVVCSPLTNHLILLPTVQFLIPCRYSRTLHGTLSSEQLLSP